MSWTPISAIGEPSGPIENGTTYIVRPLMQPVKSVVERPAHLLRVGPVVRRPRVLLALGADERPGPRPAPRREGSDSARYEFGRLASESFSNAPASTSILGQRVVLLRAAVAPVHGVGLGDRGHLVDPSTREFVARRDSRIAHGFRSAPASGAMHIVQYRTYSTSPSAGVAPASRLGTSTSRLNSATSTPSWFSTRVWTRTVPRSVLGAATPSPRAPRTRRTACRRGRRAPGA